MYYSYDKMNYDPEYIKQKRSRILDSLGIRISTARKCRNDSQDLLAKAIGVTKSTISRYENGEIEIPASILPIISSRYNYSIARMFEEISFKGALSEYENLNFMIINIINSMGNEFIDGLHYAPVISEYFSKLIDTKEKNSFDLFYVILQLMEDLNRLDKNDLKDGTILIDMLSNKFIQNIKKILQNNYSEIRSVFYQEMISKISNNLISYETNKFE